MKVLVEKHESNYFPMKVICHKVKDKYGFSYSGDYCHSELEITKEDLLKREWHKYPDIEGVDYGVICPICKSFVVVDVSDIPKNILTEVQDYNNKVTEN